ncbi:hypothetical protein BDF22DRAFT_145860 [Syncephalis plumigaleata]|nr:hypothetical protein BDF22DRAFT_145860 [Syncephalis plumigaleata]
MPTRLCKVGSVYYARCRRIIGGVAQARSELEECLNGIEEDLVDLTEAMQAIEVNPRRFQITQVEMHQRRQFINATQETVKKMRETILVKSKDFKELHERKSLLQARRDPNKPDQVSVTIEENNIYQRNNEDFIEQERTQQMMIIEQQDVQLDAVLGSVTNLKQVAYTMNDELDRHHMLLEELDEHVDRTQLGLIVPVARLRRYYVKVERVDPIAVLPF